MDNFVESDTQPFLEISCFDRATKLPLDLTGTTVKLRFKVENQGKLERDMTIVGAPTDGVAKYQFAAGELTPGRLSYEVTIIDGSGLELTSLEVRFFDVRERIK